MIFSIRFRRLLLRTAFLGHSGLTVFASAMDSIPLVNIPMTRPAETCQTFVKNALDTLKYAREEVQKGDLILSNPIPSYVESYYPVVEQFNEIMRVMAHTIKEATHLLSPLKRADLVQAIEEKLSQISDYINAPSEEFSFVNTLDIPTEENELVNAVSQRTFQLVKQALEVAQRTAGLQEAKRLCSLEDSVLTNIQSVRQHLKSPARVVIWADETEGDPAGTAFLKRVILELEKIVQDYNNERTEEDSIDEPPFFVPSDNEMSSSSETSDSSESSHSIEGNVTSGENLPVGTEEGTVPEEIFPANEEETKNESQGPVSGEEGTTPGENLPVGTEEETVPEEIFPANEEETKNESQGPVSGGEETTSEENLPEGTDEESLSGGEEDQIRRPKVLVLTHSFEVPPAEV